MAHKSKRKHVKHVHEHEHEQEQAAHHERHPAASFRELGRALVDRLVARALKRPRALKERLLRRPREIFHKISGGYSRASA